MAFRPITKEYVQTELETYSQSDPAPEKGWAEIAKDDIVNTVSNYITGAQQGWQEVDRQNENINATILKDENGQIATDENGVVQFVNGQQSFDDALAQRNNATATYNNETTKPAIMTAAPFVNPTFALTALGADLAPVAQNKYNETGSVLDAVKEVTVQPAINMYNDPELSQRFYDRPITTLTEGALVAGQALLPVVGAKRGITKAGEFKTDLARMVDEKLNTITDNPPLENIGIRGLDALDQIDAPNQGFRPANKQELQQTVMEQLEQLKAKKFDEANTQSYLNDMARQERESNALQAQKNEIAGSVLMSPLDRMEVGADLPVKRSLGGQGEVLGERLNQSIPNEIYLGEKPNNQPIIQERQPRHTLPQERPFLPRAEQLIDERNINNIYKDNGIGKQQFSVLDKKELSRQISQAVKAKDFTKASQISEQIGNTKLADTLRNVAKKQQKPTQEVKPIEKPHQELIRMVEDQLKLKQDTTPTIPIQHENFIKIVNDVNKMPSHDFKGSDKLYNSGEINNVVKFSASNSMERIQNQHAKTIFKQDNDGNFWAKHTKGNRYEVVPASQKIITPSDIKVGGMTDVFDMPNAIRNKDGKILDNTHYDAEQIHIIKPAIVENVNGEFKVIQKGSISVKGDVDVKTNESVKLKRGESIKLQSGIDPTGGRFDNVDLGAKTKEAVVKSRDRIVNGLQDDRIIDNGRKWHEKGIKDLPPVKKVLQRVYQEVFDSLDPIYRYGKEVYKSARLAIGSAVGKADSMIRNKNNPDSFENIIKPVENRLDDFAEYMVAKRAKELHATGTMTGVSNTKIAKILSEAPPEFAEVQKRLSSYSDRLVEMLVDSGMISEEHAINMFNKYESYAPMMQAFDGEQISRMFQDKGDLGKPIKNIEGSDSKVINPIESILKNTHTFHMIAETNKVRQQIASLAESFPDEIKILKSGEAAEKGTGTFDFFVDGKKMTMQLEPRLFEAIASMDSQQTSIVVKVLSKPASWLRAGATLSPEFLVKNLIRDTIGAGIVGKDFTPFVDSYKGLKSAWKKDQDYWDYKEAGGATGHLTGLDRNHLQEALDNYRAKSKVQKLSTAFNPKTWLEVLRKGQEISEDATKLGYYKKRISKGDSVKEATFEARDLLDFSRSGNYTREANKVAAFLNASLQGTDKLVRSFKERPLETAANTMKYLIMPSMAVWYMQNNSDKKDEIQNLPRYVRDMFWVIPAGDKLIRIPKPFEPGVLFATGTERTLDAMFTDKKNPYKDYISSLRDVTIPNLLPTGLVPLGEWWANKSFFTGQSIVPQKEQDLPDDMQYGPYTSNVAKFAGKVTGQSPRKIDNAIRGLTGGAGTAVTSTIDSVTGGNTNRPSQTLSDMPVVKAFIADPRKGQQSTQDFYDELDKYTKSKRAESVRGVKMTPTEKRNYEQLNNANTALKALNKEERNIIESTKFSPEVKRQKLDKIIDAQTKLVQASLKRLK